MELKTIFSVTRNTKKGEIPDCIKVNNQTKYTLVITIMDELRTISSQILINLQQADGSPFQGDFEVDWGLSKSGMSAECKTTAERSNWYQCTPFGKPG
jgi:hypothetical protein